ncbi:OmpA family protein [Aquimarina sp. RZ0]|uniref:OmpA family protein n=1 Tax=Aquimarina sp. RZ0 TaxID=2607730 RepID=UPI0011F23AA6|nr:OmpA family protein [Aquimarina sp. RZ0]KAA1243426.1 OmpA family protein [Aquimarina sp. RZ0]
MKINFNKLLFVLLWIPVISVFAQETLLKNANKNFNNLAYRDAIDGYKSIIKNGEGSLEVYQKLADAYYFNADLENAARWYERMIENKNKLEKQGDSINNFDIEYYFRAAQSYKFLKEYDKADQLIKKVNEAIPNDSRVKYLINNPDYLDDIELQSGRYEIKNLSKNSAYTDFAPSIYKDQLVFSSSRKVRKSISRKNKWTEQPYLNLFSGIMNDSTGISFPLEFSKELNSRFNESTSFFSKDGVTVYFTRNNIIKPKINKDSTGINRLRIFRARLNDKFTWSDLEDLPFNNDHYSVAHPVLNADESKLYFVSDMPGGYGMSDIYVVDILENGTFGIPKNLGSAINTEGRDTFPFISTNGFLYFSSDGHLGLGGLDIFASNLKDTTDVKVYNVGKPVNSTSDDVTFVINDTTRKGYFASNRPGGRGDDDIYSFQEVKPLITDCMGKIKVILKDKRTGEIIKDAVIEIRDENKELLYYSITDTSGAFSFEVDCNNKNYEIIVNKENYNPLSKMLRTTREVTDLSEELQLESLAPEKGVDLAKLLALKPIYFASNKALILGKTAEELNKIVEFMKKYTSLQIEIGSHTDSRGSDAYNLKLSTKRATSTANYIISKGVDSSRVKSKGYGETVLINKCGNGVKCNKQEHQLNRRSEFIVISN